MSLTTMIKSLNENIVIKSESDKNKYKIIKSFSGTYIEQQIKREERMQYPFFRVFTAAKPESRRMLNIDPTFSFNFYTDSLMDYASIISYKLKKPWYLFNRLISVHIPECPNDCWHCYLPHELYVSASQDIDRYGILTASEIVDAFIVQRDYDQRSNKKSNVLRITGGEPFLAPELILECLEEIQARKLEKDVFIWTETNLEPFIGDDSFMDDPANVKILDKIAEFNNFLVHPCFHGLDEVEFKKITNRQDVITFNMQLKALEKLSSREIEIYPTIGSNVCDPKNISETFHKLSNIGDHSLPLKTALIEYDLTAYPPIQNRLTNSPDRKPSLYSKFASLRIWNELLLKNYGIGYGILPRHLASKIERNISENYPTTPYIENEILYLFKGSYRTDYHQFVLGLLAYPEGHICKTHFDEKWAQNDLTFHADQFPSQYKDRKGLLIYADKNRRELVPIREFELVEVKRTESMNKLIEIHIRLKNFVSNEVTNNTSLKDFNSTLINYFGEATLPLGGKYFLLGEELFSDEGYFNFKNPTKDFDDIILNREADFSDIVRSLSDCNEMAKSITFKIEYDNLRQTEINGVSKYVVKKNQTFSLLFTFLLMEKSELLNSEYYNKKQLQISISDNSIKQIDSPSVSYDKYDRKELRFKVDAEAPAQEVKISILNLDDDVDSPNIELLINIQE